MYVLSNMQRELFLINRIYIYMYTFAKLYTIFFNFTSNFYKVNMLCKFELYYLFVLFYFQNLKKKEENKFFTIKYSNCIII